MIRRMLNVLVCPFDKESMLELFEIKISPPGHGGNAESYVKQKDHYKEQPNGKEQSGSLVSGVPSGDSKIKNEKDLSETNDTELDVIVEEGILFCNNCSRFFPIVEEIPIILPDEIRDKKTDIEFLKKWSEYLPEKVVKNAMPWHI